MPGGTSITSACLNTTRGLGLGQLGRRMAAATIGTRVRSAAYALSIGDALAPQHRSVIFAPFVDAGFRSVPEPATAPTEQ